MVLEAIYEQDFLPCSYGFRPGRSAHQALQALRTGFMSHGLRWVIDLDIAMHNPCIRGWINYYSHFCPTQLRPTLQRIDAYVIRWARRKFKRMRHQTKGARDWFGRFRRSNRHLFAHWVLCHGNG
jgi:group II intron maturase